MRKFGDLEQSILNLFKPGEKKTVEEVRASLGGADKYTSIMTVMARMVKKGILDREKVGLRHEYWLLDKSHSLFDRMRARLFGVKTVDVVSYLINEAEDISEKELAQIELLLNEKKLRKRKHD